MLGIIKKHLYEIMREPTTGSVVREEYLWKPSLITKDIS
jgi:hypothetical protein